MSTDAGTIHASVVSAAPPDVQPRRRSLAVWNIAALGGSTVAGQVLGAGTSLLLRTALTPTQMGIWQGIRLVLSYAGMASLGVVKGAMREYAIAEGRGDQHAARTTLAAATAATWLGSAVYAGCVCVAAGWLAWQGGEFSRQWSWGLAIAALICIAARQLALRICVLRVRERFTATANLSLIEAVLTLLVCTAAAWWGGVLGLAVATLTVTCLAWLLAGRMDEPLVGLAWDPVELRRLTAIGFPIMLAGLAGMLLRSTDRLLILACCPDSELLLGLYSTALLVTVPLYGLANIAATLLAPHLARLLGAGQVTGMATTAARSTLVQAVAMSLLGTGAIVTAGPLLTSVLPNYAEAIPLIGILVPASLALAVAVPAGQLLVTVNRQTTHLALTLAAVTAQVAATYLVLSTGAGLTALALVTLAVQSCYAAATVLVAFAQQLGMLAAGRLLFATMWMTALPLSVVVALAPVDHAFHWPASLTQASGGLLAWLLALGALFVVRRFTPALMETA